MASAILRLPEVLARTGLSRTGVYRRVAAGGFPKPVALGPRAVGWREADVLAWINARPIASNPPAVARRPSADKAA